MESDDYEVRKATVECLINSGIPRVDIRHEITLDTSSSGGRADLVVLRDGCLCGLEIKSAKDTLDRCAIQKEAYQKAFDLSVLIVDEKWSPLNSEGFWDRERAQRLWHNHLVYTNGKIGDWFDGAFHGISSSRFSRSRQLSAERMLSLLWASEIKFTFGASARHKGIKAAAETIAIREIRQGVITALRKRELNRWEEAFWKRFDSEKAEMAA
ncbi:MAG: hypothetical protein KGI54_16490 [Pseudomonadota bacterium]|nr:hypothetical protein [Pseudomonadota bacterium]